MKKPETVISDVLKAGGDPKTVLDELDKAGYEVIPKPDSVGVQETGTLEQFMTLMGWDLYQVGKKQNKWLLYQDGKIVAREGDASWQQTKKMFEGA